MSLSSIAACSDVRYGMDVILNKPIMRVIMLRHRWIYFIAIIVLLNGPLFFSSLQPNGVTYSPMYRLLIPNGNVTFYAIIAVNFFLALACLATYKRSNLASFQVDFFEILPILVQGSVQLSIYLYVINVNSGIFISDLWQSRMPFLFYQVVFAFTFDYLFTICRGKVFRPEFYVLPLVLSINLFLWFVYDYTVLHLVLIVVAILIKSYIVSEGSDGRFHHVFNPSFIVLALVALVVIVLGLSGTTLGLVDSDLASIYDSTPDFNIFVFCVGCITLWLPNSYLVSIGAYSSIMLLDYFSEMFLGDRLFFGLARGSVLIAIMLGITDPKTSPKTSHGKFLFGVTYGVFVTLFNFILAIFNPWDTYFSKILPIPLMNLMSRVFDRPVTAVARKNGGYYVSRIVAIIIFSVIFATTYPRLMLQETHPSLARVVADHIRVYFGYDPWMHKGFI